MTSDPWTTYPNGEATTVLIRHKAVLLGPQRHRGIIGFVLEEHQLGEAEQLLFAEATRYASVAVTSYTLEGICYLKILPRRICMAMKAGKTCRKIYRCLKAVFLILKKPGRVLRKGVTGKTADTPI